MTKPCALAARNAVLLEHDSGLLSRRAHVDMAVLGNLPLEIAMQTGDEAMRALGLGFADAQWAEPLPEGVTGQSRWWIDDLYMVGMLQIQAYRATGANRYADRAAAQLAAYLPRLQQDNGLFPREVCVGTGKENDLEFYLKRPRVDGDLHGQAPFLWLATELLPGRAP